MRLTTIGTALPRWPGGRSSGPAAGATAPLLPSRALVPVDATGRTRTPSRGLCEAAGLGDRDQLPPPAAGRVHAGFLAQLIAVSADLPQTRRRRRVAPGAAAASYAAATARSSTDPTGRRCAIAL